MRLIDAEQLEYELGSEDEDIYCKEIIREAPTVEAVPVVHGSWKKSQRNRNYFYRCSVCGREEYFDTPFCPGCGANMQKK